MRRVAWIVFFFVALLALLAAGLRLNPREVPSPLIGKPAPHFELPLLQAPEKSFEQYMKDMGKTIPLGRVGDAEEFASVACFLASDAGSYVSGVAINVDGGASPVV